MEPEINCSEFCDSFPGQVLDRSPFHDLCRTIDGSHSISSLSPALLGIVWTFLSCGLLLMLFFLAFTIRCRKNRIVKMSSPNLNIVTLLGSCLTYSSAYLFGVQDTSLGCSMETLIQVRLSLLCIGTSLVFGPILGKSWRLYKVFTQRVPDKRVIIKDLQLLGLVAALVMVDMVLLVTWVLTDPIQCLQILGVSMTYSDVWIALILGCKVRSGEGFAWWTSVILQFLQGLLKQWKAFEGENQTIRRMAKYFSTPSKSFHPQFGDEQNCHPRDERSSMERLLTEKNAVIESLQEQVNNAKEKLVRLMSAEYACDPLERVISLTSSQGNDLPAAASAHGLARGPSEGPPAPQNDPSTAAQDSYCTSVPSPHMQNPQVPGRNPSPSPGQKKIPDLKHFSDHLDLDNSQKPQAEQSQNSKKDQGPMAPSQDAIPGRGASDPQRQRENLRDPSEKLPTVSSIVREKLQEVIQELGLGPRAPLSNPLSSPQQLWKGSTSHSPQKMPISRGLGFSPYIVRRRRRAAQLAGSCFPGSVPSYVGHRTNQTVSRTHSGLNVPSGDSPRPDHQTTGSKVPRSSSRQPSLRSDPQERLCIAAGSIQGQAERLEATVGNAAFPRQPATHAWTRRPAAPCLPTLDLHEQQQLQFSGSSGCPILSSQCNYLDTESSSSDEFFCHCHRPYCEICFQSSSDSSDSGTSDTDPEPAVGLASWEKRWARSNPIVNFKDDLRPTLV
ncbi:probable G-protein coupled receptor 156 isoform X7 [Cavia porcellus]|uniref:probable G-protein coupled receptor 156 isoform X7 n=1 Tax=Cavia porcellus TaxID=10141 RepID=UPI002FE201A8